MTMYSRGPPSYLSQGRAYTSLKAYNFSSNVSMDFRASKQWCDFVTERAKILMTQPFYRAAGKMIGGDTQQLTNGAMVGGGGK